MDELGGFEPTDTTGFIQIESIRIKKFVNFLPLSATLLMFISGGHKPTSAKDKQELHPKMFMAAEFKSNY